MLGRIERSDHNQLGTALRAQGGTNLLIDQQMMQVRKATSLLKEQISTHQRTTDLDGICHELHKGFEDAIETCNLLSSGRFAPRDSIESKDAKTHNAHGSIHAADHILHYIHIDKEKKVLHALCKAAAVSLPLISVLIGVITTSHHEELVHEAKEFMRHMGSVIGPNRKHLYAYMSAYNTVNYASMQEMLSENYSKESLKRTLLAASLASIAKIEPSEPITWARQFKQFFDDEIKIVRSELLIDHLSRLSRDKNLYPVAHEVRAALHGERKIGDFLLSGRGYQRPQQNSAPWLGRVRDTLTDSNFITQQSLLNSLWEYWPSEIYELRNWKDQMSLALMLDSLATLDLYDYGLHKSTGEELARAFATIPARVTSLNLSKNLLYRLGGEQLADALSVISSGVTSLNLRDNGLIRLTGAELAMVFSAIPANVTRLRLGDCWFLSSFSHKLEELAQALEELPASVVSLGLGNNSLFGLTCESLIDVLSVIPSGVTNLDLSNNSLWLLTAKELAEAFATISANVTSLRLDDNWLDTWEHTEEDFDKVLAAIPASVTSLYLGTKYLWKRTDVGLPFAEITVHSLENDELISREGILQPYIIWALFWAAIMDANKILREGMEFILPEMVDFFNDHILTRNPDGLLELTKYQEIDIFALVEDSQRLEQPVLLADPNELRVALADSEARAQADREAAARDREAATLRDEAAALRHEAAALREAQLLQLIMALQSQLPAQPRPEPEAPRHFPPLFGGQTPHDVGTGSEQEEELTDVPTLR